MTDQEKHELIEMVKAAVKNDIKRPGEIYGVNINRAVQSIVVASIVGFYVQFNKNHDNQILQTQQMISIDHHVNTLAKKVGDVDEKFNDLNLIILKPTDVREIKDKIDDYGVRLIRLEEYAKNQNR